MGAETLTTTYIKMYAMKGTPVTSIRDGTTPVYSDAISPLRHNSGKQKKYYTFLTVMLSVMIISQPYSAFKVEGVFPLSSPVVTKTW